VFLVPQKYRFGDPALDRSHLGQGFQDRLIADAHLCLDAGEIEHRLGEGAVHVEQKCGRNRSR